MVTREVFIVDIRERTARGIWKGPEKREKVLNVASKAGPGQGRSRSGVGWGGEVGAREEDREWTKRAKERTKSAELKSRLKGGMGHWGLGGPELENFSVGEWMKGAEKNADSEMWTGEVPVILRRPACALVC